MAKDIVGSDESPEEGQKTEPSRRTFMVNAAAVAIGAVAAQAASADDSGAECSKCEVIDRTPPAPQGGGRIYRPGSGSEPPFVEDCCKSPSGDEKSLLALITAAAWIDPSYRRDLLTFEEGRSTDWLWYGAAERDSMILRTRLKMLEKAPALATLPAPPRVDMPVVLSQAQFDRGIFIKKDALERVFRLPNAPKDIVALVTAARKNTPNWDCCPGEIPKYKPLLDKAGEDISNICGM